MNPKEKIKIPHFSYNPDILQHTITVIPGASVPMCKCYKLLNVFHFQEARKPSKYFTAFM